VGTLVAGADVGLDEAPLEGLAVPVEELGGGCAGWAGAHDASARAATMNMEKIVTGFLLKSVLISCSFRIVFPLEKNDIQQYKSSAKAFLPVCRKKGSAARIIAELLL
jgi:hypothetical protein